MLLTAPPAVPIRVLTRPPIRVVKSKLLGLFWLSLITAIFSAASHAADPAAQQKASIDKISKQIKSLSDSLNSSKSARKNARDQLLATERKIAASKAKLNELDDKIKRNAQQKTELEARLEQLNIQYASNREALAALLLSRYKNGQDNYLKLLLNQQNPYAVGRLSNYSEYFSVAIRQRLDQLETQLSEVQQLENERQEVLQELASAQAEQSKKQQNWLAAKKQRESLVAKLDKEITESNQQLKDLREDRNRLNQLLKQIAKQAEQLRIAEEQRRQREAQIARQKNTKPVERTPVAGGFSKQKARLRYPSSGKKIRNFGSRIAASGMTSNGVFFATEAGQEVRAIYRGRVLFADFLKGYGLLLIVDHGDQHISLYGHNEVLLKSVGDEVASNEIISRSGVSGGLKQPGLYFEIRHNANPIDPALWCQ